MPDDERAAAASLVALLDQAKAALVDVAGILGEYRTRLIGAGFTPDDALELCLDVQRAVIFGGSTEHNGHAPYAE